MKVLLLDADGVVLHKGELFSERFAREYKIPLELVVDFFKGPFSECQAGVKDLKEVLPPYLEKWGWQEGVDAFLTYWFESDFHPNVSGLELIQQFRKKRIRCCMASNNERYRADYIANRLKQEDILDDYFFSGYLQVKKNNPDFFIKVTSSLGVKAEDCCFIDNDQKNIDTAKTVGIEAYLYRDGIFEELLSKI